MFLHQNKAVRTRCQRTPSALLPRVHSILARKSATEARAAGFASRIARGSCVHWKKRNCQFLRPEPARRTAHGDRESALLRQRGIRLAAHRVVFEVKKSGKGRRAYTSSTEDSPAAYVRTHIASTSRYLRLAHVSHQSGVLMCRSRMGSLH